MSRETWFIVALLASAMGGAAFQNGKPAAQKSAYTTWSDYAGSSDSAQYSALRQINKSNVGQLELAWFHATNGGGGPFNPLIIDGVMYVLGSGRSIAALNAATGEQIWSHAVEGSPTSRGINYWESKDRKDRRLIFAANSFLQQLDARTGAVISTFGNDGRVDLREGLDRDPKSIRNIQSRNPGRVFENLVIVGSVTGEGFGSPPGDIRAYDVVTGKTAWTFHTIPRPGEFGYDTWPADAYKHAGGANNWGEMSVDEKRGIVYVPLGSPTFDLYGADRKGTNLFGNCLVALDARTGKRLWHYQTVHHDLWDYDLTTAPKLLTVRHNGRPVDIVAQAGKTGFLYVFNRVTGEPLWPIEERPVPKSEVPGEESWPTQPIPTKPPPFSRVQFRVEDLNPYIEGAEKDALRDTLLKAHNAGVFTPSSHLRNHVQIPGAFGGANWGAAAVDPASGLLFVRSYDAPSIRRLTDRTAQPTAPAAGGAASQRGLAVYAKNCAACHGPDRVGVTPPRELGMQKFTRTIRGGLEGMPPFAADVISDEDLALLAAYIDNPYGSPSARDVDGRDRGSAPRPLPPTELMRFSGPFGAQWLASNGLPAIGPPWTELVAYDLNEGSVKWRVPAGTVHGLAGKGITNTGAYRPSNGPVVTAGGLVFLATGGDHTLRAYDKDTGKLLWEKRLEANPAGIPAVYEVGGRQYIVFYVAGDAGGGSRRGMNWKPGKPEAQGYYAFALPQRPAAKPAR